MFDSPGEVFMTIGLPTTSQSTNIDQDTTIEENSIQQLDSRGSCCKGYQKIVNKMDYLHKKFSAQFGVIRQEISANRKLLQQLLKVQPVATNNEEQDGQCTFEDSPTKVGQDEQRSLDLADADEFHAKYKATFPIQDCDALVEFNRSIKDDPTFVVNLYAKFIQIQADDEIKFARKVLKELCDFRCLKDFTWQGTKKNETLRRFAPGHQIGNGFTHREICKL